MTSIPAPLAHFNARDSIATLTAMTIRPYESRDPYRPLDIYDTRQSILRDLLCNDIDSPLPDFSQIDLDPNDIPMHEYDYDYMRSALDNIRTAAQNDDSTTRQYLSELLLSHSLCPMHHIDYAACFDDDEPDCATIRALFPNHDT